MQLVSGETFEIKKIENTNNNLSDSQINEKYSKGEIRIITEQARYPLDSIRSMLDSNKYNLNPEYQRRKRWNVKQQSKLIESFIINVPIPPIFIYEVSYAQYEIMDGLQRLTAIYDFYCDQFELIGLEEWSELNGRTYSTLPKIVREGIDRRYLSSIVLLNETAKDIQTAESLKQMVFGRLNSGGDKLTPQETRNALFMGKFNDFCIRLSSNDYFRKIWNYTTFEWKDGKLINENELLQDESYRKMEDVEMVLRYFAYRQLDKMSNFKTQEVFLDNYLEQANKYNEEVLQKLEDIFLKTCKLVYDIFGSSALYMPDNGIQRRTVPTKTVYDPLMQVISENLDREQNLLDNKEKIKDLLFKDANDLEYQSKNKKSPLFDGKYNSKNNVLARIKYIRQVINQALNL